jgi:hypothetical protein
MLVLKLSLTITDVVVIKCTTWFDINYLRILRTQYIYVYALYDSLNKQRLFPVTALTGWSS